MRAVLDPNVLVSALLSPRGAPAEILRALTRGEFELVISSQLLDELRRVLAYAKLRKRIPEEQALQALEHLGEMASNHPDPEMLPKVRSVDPDDDYLIALAETTRALLVSGDRDLLSLEGQIPVFSPARFLEVLSQFD